MRILIIFGGLEKSVSPLIFIFHTQNLIQNLIPTYWKNHHISLNNTSKTLTQIDLDSETLIINSPKGQLAYEAAPELRFCGHVTMHI